MGFISFNENYYRNKLEEYECNDLLSADIYEAKQLLKVLDDLTDEGYTNLNDRMRFDSPSLVIDLTEISRHLLRRLPRVV